MPWKSDKQRRWGHTASGVKALGGKSAVAEWDKSKSKKKKLKPKITVNNKIKGFGQADTKTGNIEINRKRHKGDKIQLADTIKHEMYHIKHPKATEKETYKATGKIGSMPPSEQNRLIAKLRLKKLNHQSGVIKRKLKMKGKIETGMLISKMNEQRITRNNQSISKRKLSIMGLV